MDKILSGSAILAVLNERYATKQFDPTRKVSDEDWQVLAESLRLSPSSYGLQPWKFILVKNPAVRKELRAASWNQGQVEDASHFVVFATLKKVDAPYIHNYVESIAQARGTTAEALKGYEDMMLGGVANAQMDHLAWTQRQSYIAMGFLGLTAPLMGIDTVMLEGLSPSEYDRILGIQDSPYTTVAAVALGYRSETDTYAQAPKSRFELSDILTVVE
jgi:nitroreductase